MPSIGVDTEFLRERTFFPEAVPAAVGRGRRDLVRGYPARRQPRAAGSLRSPHATSRKVIHSARQDLEAFYLSVKRVISPVFDTQIAAGCIGLKPQIGYAELVKTLLDVTLPKGQTRTDWSKRPLTREQLEYAADDVLYLGRDRRAADRAAARRWGASNGSWRIAWRSRIRGCTSPIRRRRGSGCAASKQLPPALRARARVLAVWRERLARERDLPRGWIISDAAILQARRGEARDPRRVRGRAAPQPLNDGIAESLLEALREASSGRARRPGTGVRSARPTAEQKALIDRLAHTGRCARSRTRRQRRNTRARAASSRRSRWANATCKPSRDGGASEIGERLSLLDWRLGFRATANPTPPVGWP